MDTLPESVEVYRASPFLPPGHLGRVICSGPPLTLSGCSPDPNHVGKRTVYVHLHCHAGYSPLHFVLGAGTYRISLCILRTNDHISWTPTLYQGEIPSKSTRPTNRVLLLAGILRGLWEPDPEADVRDLDIYLPDSSAPLRSLSPMKWLNFCTRLPIFTSVPRAESAMPPLLETSPRGPSPVPPWGWPWPRPMPCLGSLRWNFAPSSMGLNFANNPSSSFHWRSVHPGIFYSIAGSG